MRHYIMTIQAKRTLRRAMTTRQKNQQQQHSKESRPIILFDRAGRGTTQRQGEGLSRTLFLVSVKVGGLCGKVASRARDQNLVVLNNA